MFELKSIKLSNDVEVAYVEAGQRNQTLLFIHGLAGYSQIWQKNLPTLSQDFRCIAIDLPGNGCSPYQESYEYSIRFFAATVIDFIKALNLQNVTLVGHSLGGQISIQIAANYPEIIKALVLCAPAGFETFNEMEKGFYHSSFHFFSFFSSDANSLAKSVSTSFYHYTDQADDLIENMQSLLSRYPPHAFRNMIEKCIQAMLNEPVFHLLPKIKQPTLVFFGERDVLIPNRIIHPCSTRQIAEQGMQQLLNGRLEMYAQCGHFVHWERFQEVNSTIRNFLKEMNS